MSSTLLIWPSGTKLGPIGPEPTQANPRILSPRERTPTSEWCGAWPLRTEGQSAHQALGRAKAFSDPGVVSGLDKLKVCSEQSDSHRHHAGRVPRRWGGWHR